jgi:hypothetical protein
LGASYRYSHYKKNGLAKVDIKTKKIEKTISFPIDENELYYSHFPKQWIAVSKKNIAITRPFAQKVIILDTSLKKIKDIDISYLGLAESEKEFYKKLDTNFIKKNQNNPKIVIDYFMQNKFLDIRRVERISFINNSDLLISVVDKSYKFKRQLFIVNITNNRILDSIFVDYHDTNNNDIIDTRFTSQLYFDEMGYSFNFNGEDSINENEIYYKIKQFKLFKSISDTSLSISSELLMKADIKNVKNNKSSIDYICNYNKVLFMNYLFCFSDYCLKDIEKNELVIYITNTDNYVSNLSTKNMLEKKYKFENILFINEDKFKEQLPNIIPNKEYYILTK